MQLRLPFLKPTLALILTTAIAACAAPPQPAAPAAPPAPPAEQPATPQPEAPAQPTAAPPAERITIRYANWNLGTEEENNLQRQLVKAYTELNPNVTIEFVDMSGEGRWDEKLTSYAAKGALPDVFMADNTPLYVKNGWTADLTDLVKDDPDWKDVPQVLKDAVTYNGKVLGLPVAHFVMGYFVNKDLFEAANLDAPEYGVSVEDFFKAVTAVHNPQKAVVGLDELEPIMGWYPNTQDGQLGWFSFDGEKMNYNSAAFKAAVAKAGEMLSYSWAGLTDAQKANFKSTESWMFLNNEFAVRWDGGWSIPGYSQNAPFDWDFIGIPGGKQALVADIVVISKATKNLKAAYDFAKWMGFSKAAYAKEAELAKAAGQVPTKMPVSVDEQSIELYMSFIKDKPGIRKAMANLDNSVLESLAKIVPGYINARWEGKPGIDIGDDKDVNMWYMFNFANSGRFKYEDYAPKLEEFANKILSEARAELGK
ncbi:MAG: ABC transporter substrate-binding protein [Candidatus Roseilinea sp.]|nr:MAG: ABC transporter substrate-binding protein [Candidatus Roseilinea sp.]